MILKHRFFELAAGIAILLAVAACASKQPPVTIGKPGEKAVVIQADNFKFEPNNFKAGKGDEITLRLENISNKEHNFTIKDPKGQKLKSVDIRPMEKVTVKIKLSNSGVYEFYCDKPLHSSFGMKGKIVVGQ